MTAIEKRTGKALKKSSPKANRHTFSKDNPGPGRPKGLPNKVTQELGEAARAYTVDALATLYDVCMNSEIDAARVSAACALLDRGHGKPKQQTELKLDGSEAFLMVWQAISEGRA